MSRLLSGIGIVLKENKEMETMEVTNISTMDDVVTALQELGYHAKLEFNTVDNVVITGVSLTEEDGSSREFPMLITETGTPENGSLEFNCQICTIGDLEQEQELDDALAALAWVFLALNAEIQPWAIALINPDGELDSSDTVVLTDSVPTGDFSMAELESIMTSLLRALANVVPTFIK